MPVKNNVVSFPAAKAFSMPLDQLDSYQGRRAIARLLREWLNGPGKDGRKRTMYQLAQKANLHHNTVARIASETTKWPRLHTILALMAGLGFSAVRFE